MRNISNDYLNQFENDKPSEDCLLILQGRNGYDDNVCHLTMKDIDKDFTEYELVE